MVPGAMSAALNQRQTVAIGQTREKRRIELPSIVMRGNLLPVSWRILFLPVALDI